MKSVFYVNNVTPSIINAKYKLFRTLRVFYKQANLFDSLSKSFMNRTSPFMFVNISFFFRQKFFCFIVFTVFFVFNFGLLCLGLI